MKKITNTTYYVGRPKKEGMVYAQKTVYVDQTGLQHESTTYARAKEDLKTGFVGFNCPNAVVITVSDFKKLN